MPVPWGLSGPEFLQLYWIGLALAAILAIVVRMRVRAGSDQPVRSLEMDELPYLAGGPKRVVETALARLLTAGELRTSRRGTVQATNSSQPVNPVDRAIVTDSQSYTNRTVNLLIPALMKHDEVTAIGRRLEDMGLMVNPHVAKSTLRKGSIALWLLLAIGLARWVDGLANGADIGWLTLQIAITPVLIFFVARRGKLLRTVKGNRVLDAACASGTEGDGRPARRTSATPGSPGWSPSAASLSTRTSRCAAHCSPRRSHRPGQAARRAVPRAMRVRVAPLRVRAGAVAAAEAVVVEAAGAADPIR